LNSKTPLTTQNVTQYKLQSAYSVIDYLIMKFVRCIWTQDFKSRLGFTIHFQVIIA